MKQQKLTVQPKPADKRVSAIISWLIPIPDETPEEFDAFSQWIAAGDDAEPLAILKAAGLESDVADRNAWIERRGERFKHERILKTRMIHRFLMDQVDTLRLQHTFYSQELKRLQQALSDQVEGNAESTVKSVRLLRADIAECVRMLRQIVSASAQINNSIEPPSSMTINNRVNAQAATVVDEAPQAHPVAALYDRMRAAGAHSYRPPDIDEITDAQVQEIHQSATESA